MEWRRAIRLGEEAEVEAGMNVRREALGSRGQAEALAARAGRVVPAYGKFLRSRAFSGIPFNRLPLTDKANYLLGNGFADLLSDDVHRAFALFRSSGSSGRAFYWPQLKDGQAAALAQLREVLEGVFSIREKKTLAVVGLALGSWIGGDQFSWGLKTLAVGAPYPFTVFSPGNNHDEILDIIAKSDRFVDQILLFACPSAIGHLLLRSEQAGRPLPLAKLRYVVLGEPFPESLRTALAARAGMEDPLRLMLSIYGSADTGILGLESPASVALRRLFAGRPRLAASFGLGAAIPHFFHCAAPDAYLESVQGELCVTRWQGIPLIRYNLHDAVDLWDWKETRAAVLASSAAESCDDPCLRAIAAAGDAQPDLLAVAGRSDACLILCGTNLSEAMLDEAVRCPELEPSLTGVYRAGILLEGERQFLRFDLEFRQGVSPAGETLENVYRGLILALGRVQPEFRDDWEKVYRIWDADPEKRILRLNAVPWPGLSRAIEAQAKMRSLSK